MKGVAASVPGGASLRNGASAAYVPGDASVTGGASVR